MCHFNPSFEDFKKRLRVDQEFLGFRRGGDRRSRTVDFIPLTSARVKVVVSCTEIVAGTDIRPETNPELAALITSDMAK